MIFKWLKFGRSKSINEDRATFEPIEPSFAPQTTEVSEAYAVEEARYDDEVVAQVEPIYETGSASAETYPVDETELAPPSAFFYDDFERPDGPLEDNQAWTRLGGAAGAALLVSGTLHATLANRTAYAAPDTGSADHFAQASLAAPGGTTSLVVAVRVQDAKNLVGARYTGTAWCLQALVDGVSTLPGIKRMPPPNPGSIVRLEVMGDVLTLRVDEDVVIEGAQLGGVLADVTAAGICIRGAEGDLIGNFESGPL